MSKSLGRTSINCVLLLRSAKCVTVVKMGGVKIARSHIDQSLGRTSIGEVRNCRQKQWKNLSLKVVSGLGSAALAAPGNALAPAMYFN